VSSSCSISGTRRVTLVKTPVISHEWGKKDGIVTTTNGTYPWSSVTQIFRNGRQCHDVGRKTFDVMTYIIPSLCRENTKMGRDIVVKALFMSQSYVNSIVVYYIRK
jgi:hypothetical protein